jgi:hypothetical protein
MLFTIIYKLSKQYTQEEKEDDNGKSEVVPHYFYQKPLILIVSGSIIYFLLMNIETFKVANPFYSLIIPVDLYLLNKEIEQDKEIYRTKRLISLDKYDIDDIIENNGDKSHSNKLYYLATLIYEYVSNKKKNTNNIENSNNINDLNTTTFQNREFIESNYEPETINLCKTMEHTLDNIMNKEQI